MLLYAVVVDSFSLLVVFCGINIPSSVHFIVGANLGFSFFLAIYK